MANKQILIVDDEPLYVNFIKNVLLDLGYEIFGTASSGKKAVKKISSVCPDLILMDITLEDEMDGIETAQMILDRFDVPIIYMTAHTDSTTLTRAMITRPYGYIRKPFNEEDLQINVEMALYKHKMGQKLKSTEEELRLQCEIIKNMAEGVYLIGLKDTRIIYANPKFEKLFGYNNGEMNGKHASIVNAPTEKGPKETARKIVSVLKKTGKWQGEINNVKKDGTLFWCYANVTVFDHPKYGKVIVSVHTDITERKKAEELLQKQKSVLVQKNIALSELLGQIELEKQYIKDNVVANAENLLLPIVQKLRLTGKSRKYVQLLGKNIQELASSFGTKLIKEETKLTSKEIEICNMIKHGLTSKEIAGLLNITLGTAGRHRNNIRKKLGIINKECNLSSFLDRF